MLASRPIDILHFIAAREQAGVSTVLVTLTGIAGSSPRAVGAQMAVAADGSVTGSLSSGCVEAAVVAEALDALVASEVRQVRFGAGSPYLDIRLPCGGGIDLLFTPRPAGAAVSAAIALLEARKPAALLLSEHGLTLGEARATGWSESGFVAGYVPPLRVIAAGQGEDLAATARFARAFGAEVVILSPDRRSVEMLRSEDIVATELVAPAMLPAIEGDDWTAILSLFHDRDWEDVLLPRLLDLPAFYHGAVGSRRTHERRVEALLTSGVARASIDKLRGPVGLIPATRDPATLALSILSDVVQQYPRAFAGKAESAALGAGTAAASERPNAELGLGRLRGW